MEPADPENVSVSIFGMLLVLTVFVVSEYDPQMNADERRQTLTACAGGQSAGASAFICGLQGSQLSEILCNHKIR